MSHTYTGMRTMAQKCIKTALLAVLTTAVVAIVSLAVVDLTIWAALVLVRITSGTP